MKSNVKTILFYLLLIVLIFAAVFVIFNGTQQEKLKYSDVKEFFYNEEVRKFEVDKSNVITMELVKDGKQVTASYKLRYVDMFYQDLGELIDQQYKDGIIKEYDYPAPTEIPWWVSFLPYVVVIVLFIAIWFYVMNQASGGKGGKMNSFGRAKAKVAMAEKSKVTFRDVAGADEEKEELTEIVEYLHDPSKFMKLGARIPRGVLMVGPPGTGKTLLAKAVAGEAGVPFYSISGSDFVEMYVGVGASRVRDLFDTARKHPASIVFIDEIDAVGRHRGAGLGGGHDEREQTLNQLLVEMDGFAPNEGVIVMAATNRPDILDPALLRPGRFDRQIKVGYPDIKGREEVLRVHARNKPLEKTVDLHEVARTTVGMTGAELANLLNEAALIAARKNKTLIGMEDIEEASIKVIVGTAKKSHKRTEMDTRITAYHEAGHAVAAYHCPLLDPVRQISIVPTLTTGGYTLYAPEEDKSYASRNEMKENLISLLGGRVAEAIIIGDISTGASNDISRASSIARNMVMRYGMSEALGTIVYGSDHNDDEVFLGRDYGHTKNYSEKTAAEIDEEVRRIVDVAYSRAREILESDIDRLHFIAQYLMTHEIMDEFQFKAVMEGHPTVEELETMADERKRRSKAENEAKLKELEKEGEQQEEEHAHGEVSNTPDEDESDDRKDPFDR